jgi:hypothetical protein
VASDVKNDHAAKYAFVLLKGTPKLAVGFPIGRYQEGITSRESIRKNKSRKRDPTQSPLCAEDSLCSVECWAISSRSRIVFR